MSSDTLRIEARFKNARLWNAIVESTPMLAEDARLQALARTGPVSSFCRLYGLNLRDQQDIYALLNLKKGPLCGPPQKRVVRTVCQRLCNLLERELEWLFPSDLYAITWPRVAVEVPHAQMRRQFTPEYDDVIVQRELSSAIEAQLNTLTPREERIIRARFGIASTEMTLPEAGRTLGVSKARAAQIEAKALRKLRHPTRSRKLRPFLEWKGEWTNSLSQESRPEPAASAPRHKSVASSAEAHPPDVVPDTYVIAFWTCNLCALVDDLKRGHIKWSAPHDAIDPQVMRLYVPTKPSISGDGVVHLIVEGTALRRVSLQ